MEQAVPGFVTPWGTTLGCPPTVTFLDLACSIGETAQCSLSL
jgi:hypothetical protein